QLGQWFHRKPRPNKRNEIVDIQPDGVRQRSLDQGFGKRSLFVHNNEILLNQLIEEFLSFGSPQETPVALARSASARIAIADLAAPFGMQQVHVGAQLLRLHQIGVVPDGVLDKKLKTNSRSAWHCPRTCDRPTSV